MRTLFRRETCRDRRRRWGSAIPAAALLALLLWAPASRADLTLSIVPLSTTETSSSFTGSFEIDLTNTGTHGVTVNSFTLDTQLSPSLGITFSGVSMDTTNAPYIFQGIGIVEASGGTIPFSPSTFPTTEFTATDSDFSGSTPSYGMYPAVWVRPGKTFGLAVVDFSASNASTGTAFINLLDGTSTSNTNDQIRTLGNGLDYSSPAGSIVVTAMTATPEPSMVPLVAMAAAAGLIRFRKGRRGPSSRQGDAAATD